MEFRCSALGKLLQKGFAIALAISVPFLGLISIGAIMGGSYFVFPMFAVLILLIIAALFMGGPNAFELTDGKLRYRTSFSIKRWAGEKYGKTVRAVLSVESLQRVELRQNALEKRFDLGRVTFIGHAEAHFLEDEELLIDYANRGYDVNWLEIPAKHEFRGIKNFERLREEICLQLKDTEVLYNDVYEVR